MEELPSWVKWATVLLTVSTALIGLAVYFTRIALQGNKRVRTCEADLAEKRSSVAALEASVHGLSQSLSLLRQGRDRALELLRELETLLDEGRAKTGATADAIYVQHPYDPAFVVFLIVRGAIAHKIRKMKTRIEGSQAGAAWSKEGDEPLVYNGADPERGSHDEKIDRRSGYSSDKMLTAPLTMGGKRVGVVQFLNKRDGLDFNNDDRKRIRDLGSDLAVRVRAIADDPSCLKSLGIAEPTDESSASILFADITNFSVLFERLPASDVTDLINEYFDRLCGIALRTGSTIDKFLGDGFMARFNIPRPLADYAIVAVKSAVTMQEEFSELLSEWTRVGYPVGGISHRIGIATGPVVGGLMGHPQYLSYTAMGEAVNLAANLCNEARSTDSGLLVCPVTLEMSRSELEKIATIRERKLRSGELAFEIAKADFAGAR